MRCNKGLLAAGCNAGDDTTRYRGQRRWAGLSKVMHEVEAQMQSSKHMSSRLTLFPSGWRVVWKPPC